MKALLLGETAEAGALASAADQALIAGALGGVLTVAWDPRRGQATGELSARELAGADLRHVARRGGVRGAEGLITVLQWDRFRAVIEAAHPFDLETKHAAAAACRALGLPLLQLHRPLWPAEAPGSRRRPDSAEAACRAPLLGRVFLWIGLERLGPFAARRDLWTLTRAFTPQPGRYPLPRGDYAVGAGPFTRAHERALLRDYRIQETILENAGGALGEPMLRAAAALDIPATLIDPPPPPHPGPGGARLGSVDEALDWLRAIR